MLGVGVLLRMTFTEMFSYSIQYFFIPIYKLHIRLLPGLKIKWYSNKQYVSEGDETITSKYLMFFILWRTCCSATNVGMLCSLVFKQCYGFNTANCNFPRLL
jgi:hypothetical protein